MSSSLLFKVISLLVTTFGIEAQTECPSPYIALHSQCYYVSTLSQARTWLQARNHCQTIGGDLLTSPPDLSLLKNYIGDYTSLTRTLNEGGQCPLSLCRAADRWMGAGRPSKGTWVWLSGATMIPWQSPWPRLVIQGPACLLLSPWDGIYKDSHCEERHSYICIPRTSTNIESETTPSLTNTSINNPLGVSQPQSAPIQDSVTTGDQLFDIQSIKNLTCGLSQLIDDHERIHSNQEVKSGEYPWLVLIRYFSRSLGTQTSCSGTLIAARWVLTAAHCFRHLEPYEDVILRFGFVDLTRNDPGTPIFQVTHEDILQHSQFGSHTLEKGIALIRLPEKVSLNPIIQPICLGSDDHIHTGGTAIAAGWGLLSTGEAEIPRILDVLEVNILREDSCKDNQIFLCTSTTGKVNCQVDSGVPLMVKETGRWYQVGIANNGIIDCGNNNSRRVYTRVSNYRPFIWSNIIF